MPDNQSRVWNVRELMKSAIEHLQQKGFMEARLTVELLLAHALELQRIQLYLNFDKPVNQEELKRFRTLIERKLKHEPVQYIIGSANFMGLHFAVDPRVLIPRPETETLIEQTILVCQHYPSDEPIHIFEVGTGSGNIAVSIAKFVKNAQITAIDISLGAIDVAQQNAYMHGVNSRIRFSCTDIFSQSEEILRTQYDLLISNPPYVPKDEWEQLQMEIREFEPVSAVTDGKDGYKFYHRLTGIIPSILKHGGSVVFEVGYKQAEIVARELMETGLTQIKITSDMQGVPRVVSGRWMGSQGTFISLN